MKKLYCFLLCVTAILSTNYSIAQNGPPPRNLQFDTLTLVAKWEPPRRVVLDEHFEGAVFPPANWQDTTQGMGWFSTSDGSSAELTIPPHTTYAVVNNDLADTGNNGCCDYLVTPEMNLTLAGSYTLTFNSFFRGWDAETATVEISTDGGNTWNLLLEVLPHFTWATLTVDLSPYSGPAGSQHVQLAFKASDNGNANATGWAIDDVVVMSEELEVFGYAIFYDGTLVSQTTITTLAFSSGSFPLGFPPNFCISAIYDSGFSDMVCADFPHYYLEPPRNLEAVINASTTSVVAILTWEPPISGDYSISGSTSRTGFLNPNIEYSPNSTLHSGSSTSDAMWDELFVYQSSGPGQAGVETDGLYIYSSVWSSDVFYKYDLSGNLIESFTIPGVSGVRDMAYDGEFFYGSAATSTLFRMDLANKTLVTSINTEILTGIRHISFDPDLNGGNGGFWCGDWSHLSSITMDGILMQQAANFNLASCYGSALDPVNHKLWFHDQGGIGVSLWEFDIATLSFTGVFYEPSNLTGLIPFTGVAGGLAFTDKVVDGKWVMLGLVQQDPTLIYGLEMGDATSSIQAELLSYNIYRDEEFLVNVPKTYTEYWDMNLTPGSYCYDISAIYDLTDVGFPGQIGESQMEGPACIDNSLMIYLPFEENWTASQFDVNQWTVGSNWVMDGGNGNPAPSAKFSSQPKLTNYSSKLVSFYMNSGLGKTATPYCVWLSFDYLLDDISASGTEKLTIEIANGDTWTTLKEITNTGDVSWTTEKININPFATNGPFRIRFNINGINSEMISYWLVDNIKIYQEYSFSPVANLSADNTGNPQQNDIQLSWDVPQWEDFVELIQDDNSWETVLNINPGYSGWLGNKFTSGAGELRSVSILWLNNNSDTPVVLDIFDANHALIGSSESFVPVPGNWQTITIPALNVEGDFYTMVRFDGQSGNKDFLGMDITAPSGRPNNGWFFDGVNWSQMNAFGYPECVFLIRAALSVHKNCDNGDSYSKSKSLNSAGNNNLDSRNRNSMKSATGYTGLSHYDLYRREYTIPVAGQDSLLTEWQKIASPTTNSFLDLNLDYKCYQYYVEAMYNEGSSGPSEIAEECFWVGMDDLKATAAKLYPNPATDFLTIEINTPIDNIAAYNSTGILVNEFNLSVFSGNSQERKIKLDVSDFPSGIYNLKFTTANGESFSRKFIKM